MKKLLLFVLTLLFLTSCFETKIDPSAILYEEDGTFLVNFTANSPVNSSFFYFGPNASASNILSSVVPYIAPRDTCFISYSVNIKTMSSGATSGVIFFNENEETTSPITLSNISLGFKEQQVSSALYF